MRRHITGFYEDIEGHFVAMLDCGHEQHVRHRPPFVERPWVLTDEGRRAMVGAEIECRLCDELGYGDRDDTEDAAGTGNDDPSSRVR